VNYISALAVVLGIVTGSISLYEFIKKGSWRPGVAFSIAAVILIVAAIVVANLPSQSGGYASGISSSQNAPNSSSGTGATPAPTQAQPTQVLTPTPPPVGTVLYQANSSWSGWNGSGGWKVNGGLLLNDGTYADYNTMPTITAPYQPGADYAVEIQMQVVSAMTTGTIYPCLYITARGTSVSNGWHGYASAICANSVNGQAAQINAIDTTNNEYDRLSSTPFDPQNTWHTYRLEVKGTTIRFLVDGASLITADDSRFLDGSQIGLRSDYMEVKVSSFKIIQL
jgi:hypothetical protein